MQRQSLRILFWQALTREHESAAHLPLRLRRLRRRLRLRGLKVALRLLSLQVGSQVQATFARRLKRRLDLRSASDARGTKTAFAAHEMTRKPWGIHSLVCSKLHASFSAYLKAVVEQWAN